MRAQDRAQNEVSSNFVQCLDLGRLYESAQCVFFRTPSKGLFMNRYGATCACREKSACIEGHYSLARSLLDLEHEHVCPNGNPLPMDHRSIDTVKSPQQMTKAMSAGQKDCRH